MVVYMPEMTLSQAAEWAGKTRSTVFKAIKSGRLSARRTDDGQWMIDPAELARVYPPGDKGNGSGNSAGERHDTGRETGETEALKQVNVLLQEQVRDLRAERDRLLGVVEAHTRLLTNQRQEAEKPKASWLGSLFGR
jgi:hypothetical protein